MPQNEQNAPKQPRSRNEVWLKNSGLALRSEIHTIRGVQVMLDSDLANLYDVEVKALNQAVKRNGGRFPSAFCFQLTLEEFAPLRSQFVTLSRGSGRHRKYPPYVFTEQGVAMLSAVLRSKTAVKVSIQIIRAFVDMRRFLQINAGVFQRVETVEKRQIVFEAETEKKFEKGAVQMLEKLGSGV